MTTRFVVDAMLGNLARWLRILGHDTAYAESTAKDDDIVRLAEKEKRIVVTRDRRLAASTNSILLTVDDDLDRQLAKVMAATGEPLDEARLFTRCSLCNGPLADEALEKVAAQVPEGVRTVGRTFKKCTQCGHVYWKGTHWDRIVERVERLKRASG